MLPIALAVAGNISFGDGFIQFGETWRLGAVDSYHMSISHKDGYTAQIWRGDGTLQGSPGRTSFGLWDRPLTDSSTGIAFSNRFIQFGETWRLGVVDSYHMSISHKDGYTAQIWRGDGTLQGSPGRTDFGLWGLPLTTCSAITSGDSFIQFGPTWRLGPADDYHMSISHKDGSTAQIWRGDGTLQGSPGRTDFGLWAGPQTPQLAQLPGCIAPSTGASTGASTGSSPPSPPPTSTLSSGLGPAEMAGIAGGIVAALFAMVGAIYKYRTERERTIAHLATVELAKSMATASGKI